MVGCISDILESVLVRPEMTMENLNLEMLIRHSLFCCTLILD